MSVKAGDAFVDFHADLSSLQKEVAAQIAPITGRFGKLGKAAGLGLAGVGIAAVGAGKALYDIGSQFDQATDVIKVGTGATGKRLQGLQNDFKSVVKGVPTDFNDAASAVSQLNARLHITGKPLQTLSKQFLEVSRLSNTDLTGNIQNVSRAFKDSGIKTNQQSAAFDRLFRVSQASGVNIGDLTNLMVRFGSPLRQLGFNFNSSAAMFAKFEAEGVNVQTALPGLRMALKNFAAAGEDPAKALRGTFDQIRKMPDATKAMNLGFHTFGTRAAPDLVTAIREGRFSFQDLVKEMKTGKSTILGTAASTNDFGENFKLLRNKIKVGLEPLATPVFKTVNSGMAALAHMNLSGVIASLKHFWSQAGAVRAVFGVLLAVVKRNIGGIGQTFRGQFQVIKGVVQLISGVLSGDWGRAWKGVKNIVVGAVRGAIGIVKTMTAPIREVASRLGGAFSGPWNKIKGVFSDGVHAVQGFLNLIIDAINLIPGVSIGHVGGGGSKQLPDSASQPTSKGNHKGHAIGGKVTTPTAIVGEEAPRHPEYVLATNPAYRGRNLGLWAEAGSMLGVPGFALGGRIDQSHGGGLPNPLDIVGRLPNPADLLPDWLRGMGSYVINKVTGWIKDKVAGLPGAVASLPGKAGHAVGHAVTSVIPGLARGGVIQAIRKKGSPYVSTAYGPPWGGINGTGVTATGVNLSGAPAKQIVAVDPSVVPLHSQLSIWPNPFKSLDPFAAEDTGGAIKGNRIDFYDWKGRGHQMAWGRKGVSAMRGSAGSAGSVPPVKTGKGKGSAKAKKLGLSPALQEKINAETSLSDIHAEYAERANSLGAPVLGFTELVWLQQELAELFALRNLLIRAVEQLKAALANLGAAVKGKVKVKGGKNASRTSVGGIGPHGENDGFEKSGLSSWPGSPSGKIATWIAGALTWARTKHGFNAAITSGYRDPARNQAAGGADNSEHLYCNYPHGAVDFGGFHSGLSTKMAAVAATRDYKWPLLAPSNFTDDGHASGTGHFMGGILGKAAGHFVRNLPGFKKGAGKKATSAAGKKAGAAIKAQRDALTTKLGEVTSTLTDIQGVGSSMAVMSSLPGIGDLGGRILDVQRSIVDYGGSGGATDTPKGLSVADLKSIMALKGLGVSFSPEQFAGVFHEGGIVRVPHGGEGVAVVKDKEGVFTEGQMAAMGRVPPSAEVQTAGPPVVALKFADGMEWLRDFVSVEISEHDRESRNGYRAGITR